MKWFQPSSGCRCRFLVVAFMIHILLQQHGIGVWAGFVSNPRSLHSMATIRSEQKRQNGQFVSNYAIKPFRWDVWNKRKHPTVEVSDHYDDATTTNNNVNNQHQKKSSKPKEEDTLQVVQQSIQPSSVVQNGANVTESPVTETNNSIISERNGTSKSNSDNGKIATTSSSTTTACPNQSKPKGRQAHTGQK